MSPLPINTLAALLAGFNPSWPAQDIELSPDALANPQNMPDDPDYPPRPDVLLGCSGQLALYSFTPSCTPRIAPGERDLGLGTGIHADRAWLWTVGKPEIAIAVIDSGIDWSDPDLVSRVALNTGELPVPSIGAAVGRGHDANGDGLFNVQDYTSATGTIAPTREKVRDPSLTRRADGGDANRNGILDPQDLILIFSNGIDNDANGHIDDIAGWDFVSDDNDPEDPDARSISRPGIGHRLAATAVATANNAAGGAGVCPMCGLIPVRVAKDGIAPGNELAASIAFAVDAGARIIVTSASSIGGSTFLSRAVEYAFGRDVVVVASAGRSSSLRQEIAWRPDRVLTVGGIGFDRARRDEARSALAPDPCSGFGPQLITSAPARCDGSGAAIVAGAAGLVLSAASGIPARGLPPLSPHLSAGELHQLLAATADDIASLPEGIDAFEIEAAIRSGSRPDSSPPRAIQEGWDLRSGYGRINARRAVGAVVRRTIPVETEILSPEWFTVIDPTPAQGIAVTGRVRNRRYARVSWVLEYGLGASPAAEAFRPIGTGMIGPDDTGDILGSVPTDSLFSDPTTPPAFETDHAITLRLSASASSGGDVVQSETRRVLFVHRDLEVLPAFPIALGASVSGSPRVADLDQNGAEEIIVATGDGNIHVIDAKGRGPPGWPARAPLWPLLDPTSASSHAGLGAYARGDVPLGVHQPILGTPAIAELDLAPGFSTTAVAVVTSVSELLVFDRDGRTLSGFPIRLRTSTTAAERIGRSAMTTSPVLYDLDGDGRLEVIVATNDGGVHAVRASGEEQAGFPVFLPETVGTPAAGDVNGDGTADIVAVGRDAAYLLHGDGNLHPGGAFHAGWPVPLPDGPRDAPGLGGLPLASPVLGDIDGDGALDVVLPARGHELRVFAASGEQLRIVSAERGAFGSRAFRGRSDDPASSSSSLGALGDVDGDNALDIASGFRTRSQTAGPAEGEEPEHLFGAFSFARNAFTEGTPVRADAPSPSGAAIGDIDGDRRPEIIFGAGGYRIFALAADGTAPRSWPKLTGGAMIGAPALGDLDGDGRLEVVAVTRAGLVWAWRTRGSREGSVAWEGFAHDNRATGNVETQTSGVRRRDLGSGCGCSTTPRDASRTRSSRAVIWAWAAASMAWALFGLSRLRGPCSGGRTRSRAQRERAIRSSRAR